ncbi:MAG TPA: T9SS type A sorting domain-containing protein [Prolixibacteraceae bacterium]|nr:T9SS type A sorting domain-containing protein [Prolixibacteraceae bacterium]
MIPDDQLDIVTAAADSARAAYNIDTTAMFLTGMSCNGEFTLRQGLLRFYPFAGIFPWVPWISAKKEFNKYLIESDMPTVLSVGTFDDNFWLLMDLFDSLKAEGADINLVLAPKIGHVEIFPEFGSTMIKCVQYLTTPDIISLSPVEKISLVNDEPARDILIDISTTGSEELCVSVMANSDLFIEVPVVVYDPANGKATVSITPRAGKKGKAKVIVEAYEKEGGAIAQTVFNLEVVKPSSSVFPEAESTRLLVLPNPANQYITIQSTTPIGAYQIFDLNGRLVHNGIELGTHAEVNVQSLPKGKYILTTKATSSPVKFSLK